MILSKRERYIAIGSAAAIGLLVVNWLVLDPYAEQNERTHADLSSVNSKLNQAEVTFAAQKRLQGIWSEMQAGGLKADASQAESEALNAIIELTQYSGVTLTVLKPERTTTEGKFQVIAFSVTASGSMRQISQLIYNLETATIPVRVTELQLTPRHEGTDDLSVRLSVSTLCMLPDSEKPRATAVNWTRDQERD